MLSKDNVIARIKQVGLVAIVRAKNSEQAVKITEACIAGGLAAVEITFTVPGAQRVIEELAHRYGSNEIMIGAGTVLDPETARIAILSGAQYIISPCLNKHTVTLCNRYQVACMPGAMTVKEVVECMEAGADIVKVFPGELLGPAFIKAVKGPFPYAPLMPTGGVSLENVGEWIKAGAVAVGVGGNLIAGAEKNDYTSITQRAHEFTAKIREAKSPA